MPAVETGTGAMCYDVCDIVPAWLENPQTIVLHHGIGANTHIWAERLPVLAARYRLVRFDMRAPARRRSPRCSRGAAPEPAQAATCPGIALARRTSQTCTRYST